MLTCIPILFAAFLGCNTAVETSQAEPNPPVVSATPIVSNQFNTAWAGSGKASITPFARGENAFLGQLWLAPNAAVPEHQDPTEEYLYILSGTGTLTLDGIAHDVGPGHVIYMPANATVSYQNGASPMEAIQVFAGPSSADKYAKWGSKPL